MNLSGYIKLAKQRSNYKKAMCMLKDAANFDQYLMPNSSFTTFILLLYYIFRDIIFKGYKTPK